MKDIALNARDSGVGAGVESAHEAHRLVRLRTVIGVVLVAFTLLALLQTLARYSDSVEADPSFLGLAFEIILYYPPWMIFSTALFVLLERRAHLMADGWGLLRVFAVSHLLFYCPYMVYEVTLVSLQNGWPLSEVPMRLATWPGFGYFVDYVLFCGIFGATFGSALIRGQIERDRRNQRLQAKMLNMQLQLEHQRLAAIQAQLEPHFLFNALNAISGLVRGEEKKTALAAIARLSKLLRYTLGASRRDWVSLADELAFVRDYLNLQALRHGERLQVRIEAEEEKLRDVSCPPLLLQPLVENALRHDLETHQGNSDILLQIGVDKDGISLHLSNPVREHTAPNPGLGLGLSHTRERLRLRYSGAARIQTQIQDGRYEVDLWLPDVET